MGWPKTLPLNAAIDRASITDGRGRFRALLRTVNVSHGRTLADYRDTRLILRDVGREDEFPDAVFLAPIPKNIRVIAVPGYLTECISFLSNVLTDAMAHLESLGIKTLVPALSGRGGAVHNARQLRDAIMALPEGETTILIAMSKGAVDTQEMLALYPETHARVQAVVGIVGVVCGSPLVHMVPKWLKWLERHLPMPHCRRHDGDAVQSLTPEIRQAFLEAHTPVPGLRYYSVCAAAEPQFMSKGMAGAYQALCAINPLNDGQVLLADQILPSSEVLGVLNCDHIASAMPFNRKGGFLAKIVAKHVLNRNAFPREVVTEAIVRRVLEDL